MSQLFKRDISVKAGPLVIEARTASGFTKSILKMRFDITKTDAREPNKAQLSIWNLGEESRSKLQEKDLEVIIEAGYLDETWQIFKGDIDNTIISKESVDWIVALELGDGSKQMKKSRMNQSFRGPQTTGQMLKKAAEALGLDKGNLESKTSILKELISGSVLSGNTADIVDDIAKKAGLKFSVQNKSTIFLGKGEALSGPAEELSFQRGLIGSPQIGEKGVVTAQSLLNGRFEVGKKVDLVSRVVSGQFIIKRVQHVGDTWGDEWNSNLEMVLA